MSVELTATRPHAEGADPTILRLSQRADGILQLEIGAGVGYPICAHVSAAAQRGVGSRAVVELILGAVRVAGEAGEDQGYLYRLAWAVDALSDGSEP